MIQTGFESRIKVQDLIDHQLPEFILDESPNAVEFLKQYYISQEYQGGPIDISDNLDQYLKLDNLKPEVIVDSTTTSNSITSTDTTINVSSTKGFPNQYGLLKINDEIIKINNHHWIKYDDRIIRFDCLFLFLLYRMNDVRVTVYEGRKISNISQPVTCML